MTTENVNKFNTLTNYLFSHRCITIIEFNNIAKSHGYNKQEISQFLQHLLKSKRFVQYEGKIFAKKSILSLNTKNKRRSRIAMNSCNDIEKK